MQSGTHTLCDAPFADHVPVDLATLPPWLDEFGSNNAIFCFDVHASAGVEGTATAAAPATEER